MPGMQYTIEIADKPARASVDAINKSVDNLEKKLDKVADVGTKALETEIPKAAQAATKATEQATKSAEKLNAELSKSGTAGAKSMEDIAKQASKSSAVVDELRAKFKAAVSPSNDPTKKAAEQATAASKQLGTAFKEVAVDALGVDRSLLAVAGTGAVVGTVLVGTSVAAYKLVAAEAEVAQQTEQLAQRLGVSNGQMEKLQALSRISGVALGTLAGAGAAAAAALAKNDAEGEALRKTYSGLSIQVLGFNGKQREQGAVLNDVLSVLSRVDDRTQRLALSNQLLGDKADDLRPLVSNLQDLQQAVQRIGTDDNAVKVLSEVEREIKKSDVAWESFKRNLAAKIAPIIIPITRVVTDVFNRKVDQEQPVPDAILLARASERERTLTSNQLDPSGTANFIRRMEAANAMNANSARGQSIAGGYFSGRLNTEAGLEDRLRKVTGEADDKRAELELRMKGGISAEKAGILKREIQTLEGEEASIRSRIEGIRKSADTAKRDIEELKSLEQELGRLQAEAELKPYGALGQIELRRRNRITGIKETLPPGASRDRLVAGFDRAFGEELAVAAREQGAKDRQARDAFEKIAFTGTENRRDFNRRFFGTGDYLKEQDQILKAEERIRQIQISSEIEALGRSKEIQIAQLEELSGRSVAEKISVERKKLEIELEYLKKSTELQKKATDGQSADEIRAKIAVLDKASADAEAVARAKSAADQVRIVRQEMDRTFDSIKDGVGRLFDSATQDAKNFADVLKDGLKSALLAPLREGLSTGVARLLTGGGSSGGNGGFGGGFGQAASYGGNGYLGGLSAGQLLGLGGYSGGFTPGFNGGSGGGQYVNGRGGFGGLFGGSQNMFFNSGSIAIRPGYSTTAAGIGGFKGAAAGFISSPGAAMLGAGLALNGLQRGGILGSTQTIGGSTLTGASLGAQIGGLGMKGGAIVGFGGGLFADGLRRGGWGGVGETTAGGALIGAKFGGPIGGAIGAGVGFAAGLIRLGVKGAVEKAKEKAQQVYSVKVSNDVAKAIVDAGKTLGGLDVAITAPQVREMVELHAMATGQKIGAGAAARPVNLVQNSSGIYQMAQQINGQAYAYTSPFATYGGVATQAMPGPAVIQLDANATRDLLEGKAVQAMQSRPTASQQALTAPLEWTPRAYAG